MKAEGYSLLARLDIIAFPLRLQESHSSFIPGSDVRPDQSAGTRTPVHLGVFG